jgi:xanthine dehydrogenase large subunit
MEHIDAPFHTRGESEYVDDVPAPEGMLHGAIFTSPVAHGDIESLDASAALERDGVVAVYTAEDIPGKNAIGPIMEDDDRVFAEDTVHYRGEPVAFVVAESHELARDAAEDIDLEVDEKEVVVDPEVAHAKGNTIGSPRTFELGDVDEVWEECDAVFEGECEIAGQEHIYLETNRARAVPEEGETLAVYSSTQSPYNVQSSVANVLGIEEQKVEVDVKRLGGGFSGKEDQATQFG